MIFEVVFEGYVRGDGPSVGTPSRDDVQAVLGRIMDELLNRGVDSPAIWAEATQGAARIRVVVDSSEPDDALRTAGSQIRAAVATVEADYPKWRVHWSKVQAAETEEESSQPLVTS